MKKQSIYALILIALLMVVFIVNRGKTDVNLLVTQVSALKSLVFLGFTAVGVVIGILLK
jgi:uncharacterized integral membrane protein